EKTKCQHTHDMRKAMITQAQERVKHGFLYEADATKEINFADLADKLKQNFPLFKNSEGRKNVHTPP
ncbi:MAG: hypothetical protein V1645_04975, partial [archaeon]